MPCSSHHGTVERTQPLLGTLVNVCCRGLAAEPAHCAIDAAFAAIAAVHRLMSFHEPTSDVSRLNRCAAFGPVEVDSQTLAVLSLALELAEASGGAFDVSVAERLVAWKSLPRPPSAPTPDPAASWRDIELLPDRRVRFHRPLWIDLGGIAKGYAVDRAVERIVGDPSIRWIVNAGGDLRVAGDGEESVLLRTDRQSDEQAAVMELENASLASSSGRGRSKRAAGETMGPHLDGRRRRAVGGRSFVSVVARECALADALTKVVLALRAGAAGVLDRYGATAFLQDPRGNWKTVGTRA